MSPLAVGFRQWPVSMVKVQCLEETLDKLQKICDE